MTVSGNTQWRQIGDVSAETWERVIREHGGPDELASRDAWETAKPHSLLALGMLRAESSYGTSFKSNKAENKNALNLKVPAEENPTRPFAKYPTWTAGMREWRERITDDEYADGAYARTKTLEDLVHVYAPSSDDNDEDEYVEIVAKVTNTYGWEDGTAALMFGNVEHPAFIDRLIPDNQNRAWDDLGKRRPVGACQHSMIGSLWGTDGWFRRSGGTSLTDYGIGNSTDGAEWDGMIIRWNDPLGRAHNVDYGPYKGKGTAAKGKVSANRAGWANGGSNGLEGDGPAYVRKLGVAGINRNLVSIERADGGSISTPMSAKQFASICALTAYWFDVALVPWNAYPLNPDYDIVTHMIHKEFATKDCPFPPVYGRIDDIQNRVRAILKAAQLEKPEGQPIPAPGPVEPDKAWPNGWRTADLAKRFGTINLQMPDGSRRPQKFDENGPISNAWVQKAAELGITKVADIPTPLAWSRHRDKDDLQVDMLVFDGSGADNWMLLRPAAEVAWRWVR